MLFSLRFLKWSFSPHISLPKIWKFPENPQLFPHIFQCIIIYCSVLFELRPIKISPMSEKSSTQTQFCRAFQDLCFMLRVISVCGNEWQKANLAWNSFKSDHLCSLFSQRCGENKRLSLVIQFHATRLVFALLVSQFRGSFSHAYSILLTEWNFYPWIFVTKC